MSYYISISFFNDIIDETSLFEKALSFCHKMLHQQANKEIESNLAYFPSNDTLFDLAFHDSSKLTVSKLTKADILFLERIFTYKFIYWKKYKLLGVIHDTQDDVMSQVVFQNSTDQDAEYSTWSFLMQSDNCRECFRMLLDDTLSGANDTTISKYWEDRYDEVDDYRSDYYKQSYVYHIIEDKLHIIDYLYHESTEDMTIFNLGAYISDNTNLTLRQITINAYKNYANQLKSILN